jgi:nucleotide-binding universal stress UspA family protein
VSQNVLGHAPCSVRIGRCSDAASVAPAAAAAGATGPLRVVLGVDGSPDSAAAVQAVGDRAWPAGTEVRVVTVLDAKMRLAFLGFGPWAWAGYGLRDGGVTPAARQRVDKVAEELHDRGLVAVGMVVEGDPKRVLVEEAEQWAADCIFLGARGHGRAERFLLGSVSAAVAARAHCSVEVIRPG